MHIPAFRLPTLSAPVSPLPLFPAVPRGAALLLSACALLWLTPGQAWSHGPHPQRPGAVIIVPVPVPHQAVPVYPYGGARTSPYSQPFPSANTQLPPTYIAPGTPIPWAQPASPFWRSDPTPAPLVIPSDPALRDRRLLDEEWRLHRQWRHQQNDGRWSHHR